MSHPDPRFRIHVSDIPTHLGVSWRTVRRWLREGRMVVADDMTVDDVEATELRDLMRDRRRDTLKKGLA